MELTVAQVAQQHGRTLSDGFCLTLTQGEACTLLA